MRSHSSQFINVKFLYLFALLITKHFIFLAVPPVILDNSTVTVQTTSGTSVSLSCYAAGFPVPKVSWRRENNDILPTGGVVYRGNILTIHDISKEDRGTYYCIAENGVGKGAQRHVGVEVECK